MGPTAAGKTDAAIALAESYDVELISVDSALVYRGLCIGAAQPEYPHHLMCTQQQILLTTHSDVLPMREHADVAPCWWVER